jgi:hypothetical protein
LRRGSAADEKVAFHREELGLGVDRTATEDAAAARLEGDGLVAAHAVATRKGPEVAGREGGGHERLGQVALPALLPREASEDLDRKGDAVVGVGHDRGPPPAAVGGEVGLEALVRAAVAEVGLAAVLLDPEAEAVVTDQRGHHSLRRLSRQQTALVTAQGLLDRDGETRQVPRRRPEAGRRLRQPIGWQRLLVGGAGHPGRAEEQRPHEVGETPAQRVAHRELRDRVPPPE